MNTQSQLKLLQGCDVMITGVAGFIGFCLADKLLSSGIKVIGIDNLCETYYPAHLKYVRLRELQKSSHFVFHPTNICDIEKLRPVFERDEDFYIVHLAAQASVLPSFDSPFEYVQSNVMGTQTMLELARESNRLVNLVYASSSSVYGRSVNKKPFVEGQQTTTPISVYGATKLANEAMMQVYADRYHVPVTGLRFFKVYGPWGRPDTVFFKFVDKVYNDQPVTIHNHGDIHHSFTYIDDVVNGMITAIGQPVIPKSTERHPIYNLGNPRSESILDCLEVIEKVLDKKAIRQLVDLPEGDRFYSKTDIALAEQHLNYEVSVPVSKGLEKFIDWYKRVYVPSLHS